MFAFSSSTLRFRLSSALSLELVPVPLLLAVDLLDVFDIFGATDAGDGLVDLRLLAFGVEVCRRFELEADALPASSTLRFNLRVAFVPGFEGASLPVGDIGVKFGRSRPLELDDKEEIYWRLNETPLVTE